MCWIEQKRSGKFKQSKSLQQIKLHKKSRKQQNMVHSVDVGTITGASEMVKILKFVVFFL